MTTENDELEVRIDRAFSLLAFTVNRHLIEHMRRIALELQMDFELAYIYGTLAHINIAPFFYPGAQPNELLDGDGHGRFAGTPVRLTDLAQVTGLPRETVRRKLELLLKLGKVERTPDGLWCYAKTGVDAHVTKFTKQTILRFLNTADELRATMALVDLSTPPTPQ
jgi:hypothetical protein